MREQQKHIRYYKTKGGRSPFPEWLETLSDHKGRAKIKGRLERVERGNFGDAKSVGEGVYELRIHYGAGYRVYFSNIDRIIVLLLCGGTKGSQNKDIKLAIQYWKDYQKRGNENG